MNMYRRNNFKSWFLDVGFIYLVVVGFVVLVFTFKNLRSESIVSNAPAGFEEGTAGTRVDPYTDGN
jgi:hypothetical protein